MADFDTQRSLQKNRIRRRGIYLLPNLFTTAALFAGFYAIVQAMNFRFGLAAVAIFVAMVLDGLDGRVARLTRTQSAFGAEYDSLSDMVSFGAAPALIVYEWALKGMGNLGWIAAFVYVAGAALRLARFNVMLEVADKRWFTGIPSPAAAALVAGLVWIIDDYNIDPKLIEPKITKKTRASMPVHLYGQAAPMDEINAIASRHSVAVVEDAAQAVGAEYKGKRAGALGAIGCFSFFPSKNLGAFGDAGAVTTNDAALAEKLIDFRVHGMRPKYYHRYVGGNFRIDALQAAILHVKLPHLDAWSEGRRRNAAAYAKLFAEARLGERVVLPREMPGRHHVFNQYIIRFPEGRATRERVMAHLRSVNIGCEVYYPLTLPQQECFRNVAGASDRYPCSDQAADQTLAIPVFPELTADQMAEVVGEVKRGLA